MEHTTQRTLLHTKKTDDLLLFLNDHFANILREFEMERITVTDPIKQSQDVIYANKKTDTFEIHHYKINDTQGHATNDSERTPYTSMNIQNPKEAFHTVRNPFSGSLWKEKSPHNLKASLELTPFVHFPLTTLLKMDTIFPMDYNGDTDIFVREERKIYTVDFTGNQYVTEVSYVVETEYPSDTLLNKVLSQTTFHVYTKDLGDELYDIALAIGLEMPLGINPALV